MLAADTHGDLYLVLIVNTVGSQATTYVQIMGAEHVDNGDDLAHMLSRLPGLRQVAIGGSWTNSPETWAAIMPSLSVCQDLRLLPGE